ncbi:uncharacterized protein LOC135846712 [Planococcus citri]|uniref:uncharacterized protein LOC135846712 n=1 Tax=Planococcus citri TaxID=170843 RepID=UPI0031F881D0
MKTTRDTLLVVFVSFISIVQLARCGPSTLLDDRDKETEEIEKLVRKEIITSLQLLGEDDDDIESETFDNNQYSPSYAKNSGNGRPIPGRFYQMSNQSPKISENSYKTPDYTSYYDGAVKPTNGNGVQINRSNGNSNSRTNFRYNTPNPETRGNGNVKSVTSNDARSIPSSSSASSMNTREPGEYSTTVTLPSLGVGRLLYGGGGGAGGGYGGGVGYSGSGGYGGSGGYSGLAGTALRLRPSSMIRRGIRRLGRLGGRYGLGYGAGGGGSGVGYGVGGGNGLGYGAGGSFGGQGVNIGYGGGARGGSAGTGGYDEDYDISLNTNGGQGYYGNGRYGLQGSYGGSGSGSGGSWSLGGGSNASPNEYYNLRYGYPSTSNSAISVDGTSGEGVGGSRRYTLSYPNDASSTTISTADQTTPPQYELMFLRNQPGSSNVELQSGSNQDVNLQLQSTGSASEANRDTSNGSGYRINVSGSGGPSTLRRTSTTGPDGVEEYRVVVVNKDGNGSGRSGVSLSTTGSAPGGGSGSGSWSVSSSSSGSSGGSGGRGGQGGFQITTPITSTQVSIPSTSIVGSVLSSVQGAASGEQTRGLSSANDSAGGKIIQVIPLKTSN